MQSMEKWNSIVSSFNEHKKSKEEQVQSLWEQIFTQFFNYGTLLKTLDAQKSFSIGSSGSLRPDIILKRDSKPICAVELKQESMSLSSKYETQLFSYLKQIKCNVGVIIADKIYLYAYEYQKDDSEQTMIEIPFDKNNPDGEAFVELFSYDAFNDDAIFKFVKEKIDHLKNVKSIRESISKNYVVEVLKKYLGEKYSNSEIEEALDSIEIIIEKKKENQINKEVILPKAEEKVGNKKVLEGIDAQTLIKGGKSASTYIREFLLSKNYIDDSVKTTLAKINKDSKKENKRYWANPSIEFLKYDWVVILNDNINRKLYIFRIPANSIHDNEIRTRVHQGKTLLDIEIVNKDNEFVCLASKMQFNKWLVEEVKY